MAIQATNIIVAFGKNGIIFVPNTIS